MNLSSSLVYLIAAIFFKQLPMEFSSFFGKVAPAVLGGRNMMIMGAFSYLTETTPEENRLCRFGIFSVFNVMVPTVFEPFSGVLFSSLGYISKRFEILTVKR